MVKRKHSLHDDSLQLFPTDKGVRATCFKPHAVRPNLETIGGGTGGGGMGALPPQNLWKEDNAPTPSVAVAYQNNMAIW